MQFRYTSGTGQGFISSRRGLQRGRRRTHLDHCANESAKCSRHKLVTITGRNRKHVHSSNSQLQRFRGIHFVSVLVTLVGTGAEGKAEEKEWGGFKSLNSFRYFARFHNWD